MNPLIPLQLASVPTPASMCIFSLSSEVLYDLQDKLPQEKNKQN